nr:hypothetical protein [Tanacetum cinerariifolium]
MAQGHTQEEGIDYDEVFVPVARIEAIRLFLAYASFKDFVVYQMDVNSVFLYEKIEEEVYVCQPPGFEDPGFPDKVYKVEKALYGLHQAPRAWYETLSTYLLDNGFQRGMIYNTLFIKRDKRLQVKHKEDGIFISQDKYVNEILNKFGFFDVKTASTPMETHKTFLKNEKKRRLCACAKFQINPKISHLHAVKRIFRYLKCQPKLGLWYPKDSPFDLVAYTDNDYAGASLDRKSTTGCCQFTGCRLISWQCKKQTVVANSTTEAEYLAASSRCGKDVLNGMEKLLRMKLAKNINEEAQIHAKVDGKKVVIFEASIWRDLWFGDKGGIDCLSNETIFEQLSLMRFIQVSLHNQLEEMANHTRTYVPPSHTKKIFRNIKRVEKGFSERDIPLFPTMMVQAQEKKQKPRKPRRQDTEKIQPSDPIINVADEDLPEDTIPTHSNDPPLLRVNTLKSGEDRIQLKYLMELYTKLSDRVLNLETTKTAQANEIANLKKRVKRQERKRKSSTRGLKRLYKVGLSARVESSADEESLDEEDSSKQGRISNIDPIKTSTWDLQGEEVVVEEVNAASITTPISAAATTTNATTTPIISMDEITLDKALIEIKTSRPKEKGLVMQEPSETPTPTPIVSTQQPSKVQDKEYRWKPRALKNKMFGEIKELFNKAMERINSFVDFRTELVEENDENESAKLKRCLEIVPDDGDEVTIDATPLSVKTLIVDYKIYKEGRKSFFQIISADGNSQMYLTFSKMLKNFDREDLEVLWRLVKERFIKTKPVDDMDNFILHTLKTMFKHHVEDTVWKSRQGLTKMYPLTNHTLRKMFNNVKLQVGEECEMAFEILRLVKKQLKEGYIAN